MVAFHSFSMGKNDYGLSSSVYRPQSSVNLASLLAGVKDVGFHTPGKGQSCFQPKTHNIGVLAYPSISELAMMYRVCWSSSNRH